MKIELFGVRVQVDSAAVSAPEGQANGVQPSATPTPATALGKRVLIVDDDPVFLEATAMKLAAAGFQVVTAKESSEAIAALGQEPADAILLDIVFPAGTADGNMGAWDGFQLMYWLRGLPSTKGARFIIVSATDSPANRQRAQQLGAAAYFQKPVDHDKLIAAIEARG